ncbi:MAG: Crp/Fnr family transcriptional regulator [Desulfovibrionaceae bacterium]|nr:Crp/Fnr family transcriptional regulator [Desulfovibrionaceae bacterium]
MPTLPCSLEEKKALLRDTPLFATLSPEELHALAPVVSLCEHPRGSIILKEGDKARSFHILTMGLVKMVHHTTDGREIVLHLVKPGGSIGESAVFQQSTYPASAVAVDKTRSLHISGPEIVRLIRGNADLALHLLAVLSIRLRMFTRKLEANGSKASQRLAAYLLHRKKNNADSPKVHLDMSREVLANMLGLARETLSRAFSKMAQQQVLEVKQREIIILDEETLVRLAAGGEASSPDA